MEGEQDSPKSTPQAEPAAEFDIPAWARSAVWYQIFPERFRNGDRTNDPHSTVPWSHRWSAPYQPDTARPDGSAAFDSGYRERGEFYKFIYDRRYGGDLAGVREKLPYLRDLGITAIYYTPIFAAESLHKYDTSDFRHVDDGFGVAGSLSRIAAETADPATWQWSDSDRLFLDFVAAAHRLGFRVVLDGVFNHVGRRFWAFQDVLLHGANSRYVDWFDLTDFEPLRYLAWDGPNGVLPRLKHDDATGLSAPVREHIFAITRRWMAPDGDVSAGIDGWRLDAAGDVNEHFWRDWRKLVKSINPQAFLVGEIWDPAPQWLTGDRFDAVMNYEFARRCHRFFVNIKKATKPSVFAAELDEMRGWYPEGVNRVLQNLFGSHDTDRLASMFMNPDVEYNKMSRQQDDNPAYDANRPTPHAYRKARLAIAFQMLFPGAPLIYYGDEVGMYGASDPNCRKPMWWADLPANADPEERIEPGLFEHVRRMIALRNTLPALQGGNYRLLQVDDRAGTLAFERTRDEAGAVVVIVNNSDHPARVRLASPWPNGARPIRWDLEAEAAFDAAAPELPAARATLRATGSGTARLFEGTLETGEIAPRSVAVIAEPVE